MWYAYSYLPSPLTLRHIPFNPVLFHDPHTAVPHIYANISLHTAVSTHQIYADMKYSPGEVARCPSQEVFDTGCSGGSEVECHDLKSYAF